MILAITCSGGRQYMSCRPTEGQNICGDVSERLNDEDQCEEGCYCPKGTYLRNSKCVAKEQCPCMYRGKEYPSGTNVPKDCNTCDCVDGKWTCTEVRQLKCKSIIYNDLFIKNLEILWYSLFNSWRSTLCYIRWKGIQFYGKMFLLFSSTRYLYH